MKESIVCFGDNCVDRYDAPSRRRFVGGNAVNTAVHARAAGCRTSYVGSVGNDEDGRAILKKLQEKDIDVRMVQVFDMETAWTKVSLQGGERIFLEEYLGPVREFRLTEEVFNYLFQHTIIHNTWQGGTEERLKDFKEKGDSLISMDFGERYSQEFFQMCIPFVDIAFFSMDPSTLLDEAKAFAHSIHSFGPKHVIVTLGKKGSVVSKAGDQIYYEPAKLIRAVDTLGAGDTYIGTFLAKLAAGKEIPECMELASAAAARTCSVFSGFEGSEILI